MTICNTKETTCQISVFQAHKSQNWSAKAPIASSPLRERCKCVSICLHSKIALQSLQKDLGNNTSQVQSLGHSRAVQIVRREQRYQVQSRCFDGVTDGRQSNHSTLLPLFSDALSLLLCLRTYKGSSELLSLVSMRSRA